jgi:hypothetical protein
MYCIETSPSLVAFIADADFGLGAGLPRLFDGAFSSFALGTCSPRDSATCSVST